MAGVDQRAAEGGMKELNAQSNKHHGQVETETEELETVSDHCKTHNSLYCRCCS